MSGIVDLDTMKKLMPLVTAGGNVYRAQIVGYFDEEGPAYRIGGDRRRDADAAGRQTAAGPGGTRPRIHARRARDDGGRRAVSGVTTMERCVAEPARPAPRNDPSLI